MKKCEEKTEKGEKKVKKVFFLQKKSEKKGEKRVKKGE